MSELSQDTARHLVDLLTQPLDRRFPIMGSELIKSVPWGLIEPHEEQADRNHGQSLKKLAARGGLSPREAVAVITNKPSKWLVDQDFELLLFDLSMGFVLKQRSASQGGTKGE